MIAGVSPTDAAEPPTVLGRADGVLGELVLRARSSGGVATVELIGNGVFLMDSGNVTSERALARRTLQALGSGKEPGRAWHLLVGGLGLGVTAIELLADPRVATLTVVEVEPALVRWVRRGLVPGAQSLVTNPRVDVVVENVTNVLARTAPGSLDAVLLDVDNGPDFLTHPTNGAIYRRPGLAAAAATLRAGGLLSVWSSSRSPALEADLGAVLGCCDARPIRVRRAGRDLEYVLYTARRG